MANPNDIKDRPWPVEENKEHSKAKLLFSGVSIKDMDAKPGESSGFWGKAGEYAPIQIQADHAGHDVKQSKRFEFCSDSQRDYFHNRNPYVLADDFKNLDIAKNYKDLLSAICERPELAEELGKYLHAKDIINLYCVSGAFHEHVKRYMTSSVRQWLTHQAPEAMSIFTFKLYRRALSVDLDEIGTGAPLLDAEGDLEAIATYSEVRLIPGMRYLQLVLGRKRYCRDIIAIMARNGHRMPATMYSTLLRLWLLMELPASFQRRAMIRNKEFWTDVHIYNAQFFFIKVCMHFNDPVYGEQSHDLLSLMLGQKGLFPLWQLLTGKKYTTLPEILKLKYLYDVVLPANNFGQKNPDSEMHGVPISNIGSFHREGWGLGEDHLIRPDELVPLESWYRGLQLENHLMQMAVWGHVDLKTGENLVPTEEELYLSDEEDTLGGTDTTCHWRKKHALKKKWTDLSLAQRAEIVHEDEDERLRAMAYCGDDINDYLSETSSDDGDNNKTDRVAVALDDHFLIDDKPYCLEDEIRRGMIIPPRSKDNSSEVPGENDKAGWTDFVNRTLINLPPTVTDPDRDKIYRAGFLPGSKLPSKVAVRAWAQHDLAKQMKQRYNVMVRKRQAFNVAMSTRNLGEEAFPWRPPSGPDAQMMQAPNQGFQATAGMGQSQVNGQPVAQQLNNQATFNNYIAHQQLQNVGGQSGQVNVNGPTADVHPMMAGYQMHQAQQVGQQWPFMNNAGFPQQMNGTVQQGGNAQPVAGVQGPGAYTGNMHFQQWPAMTNTNFAQPMNGIAQQSSNAQPGSVVQGPGTHTAANPPFQQFLVNNGYGLESQMNGMAQQGGNANTSPSVQGQNANDANLYAHFQQSLALSHGPVANTAYNPWPSTDGVDHQMNG